jgi:hypothetical protein
MASADGWTNVGRRRIRMDDVGEPTRETSWIEIEQPGGYVFDETDDENSVPNHVTTGIPLSTPVECGVAWDIQSRPLHGWDDYYVSVDGDVDVIEAIVMTGLGL